MKTYHLPWDLPTKHIQLHLCVVWTLAFIFIFIFYINICLVWRCTRTSSVVHSCPQTAQYEFNVLVMFSSALTWFRGVTNQNKFDFGGSKNSTVSVDTNFSRFCCWQWREAQHSPSTDTQHYTEQVHKSSVEWDFTSTWAHIAKAFILVALRDVMVGMVMVGLNDLSGLPQP